MNKRFIFSIAWIVLGITFLVCSILGILDDFWSGLGCGLFAVGTMQLIRVKRYASNPDYRTAVDTEVNDERNKYISMRAWAWAGYSYIMICAAAVILLKIAGMDRYVGIASGGLCLMLVMYRFFYFILQRKY